MLIYTLSDSRGILSRHNVAHKASAKVTETGARVRKSEYGNDGSARVRQDAG